MTRAICRLLAVSAALSAAVVLVNHIYATKAEQVSKTITLYPAPGGGGALTGEIDPDLLDWAAADHTGFDKAYTKAGDTITKYSSSGTYSDNEKIAYAYPTGTSGYYNGYVTDKHVIMDGGVIRFLGYQVDPYMDKVFAECYADAFDSMSFTITPSNLNYHTFSETGFLFNGTFASNGSYTGYMLLLKNSSSSNTGTASLQLVYVNNGAMSANKYAPAAGARTVLGTYKSGIQNRDSTPVHVQLDRDSGGAFRLYVDGVLAADVENSASPYFGFGFFTGYFSHNCPILSVVQYDSVKFTGTFPPAQGDARVEFYNYETGSLIDADPQLASAYYTGAERAAGTRCSVAPPQTLVLTGGSTNGTWEFVESDPANPEGFTLKSDTAVVKLYYCKPSDAAFKTAQVDGVRDKGTANDPVRVSPNAGDPRNEIDYRVDLVNTGPAHVLAGGSYAFDIGTGKDITAGAKSNGYYRTSSGGNFTENAGSASMTANGYQNTYGASSNQSFNFANTAAFQTPSTLTAGTYRVKVTMSVTAAYVGASVSRILAAAAVDKPAPVLATPLTASPTLASETAMNAWGPAVHNFGSVASINTGSVTYTLPNPVVIPAGGSHSLSVAAGLFVISPSTGNGARTSTVTISKIELVPDKFTLTDTLPKGVELVTPYNFRYTNELNGVTGNVNVNLSAGSPAVTPEPDGRQTVTWEFGTLYEGVTSFHFLTKVTGAPDSAAAGLYTNSAVFKDVRTGVSERTNKTYHTPKFKVTEMFHPYLNGHAELKKPNVYQREPRDVYLPGRTVYDPIQKYDGAALRTWRYYGYSLDGDPAFFQGKPPDAFWDENTQGSWNLINDDHTLHLYFVEDVKVTVYYYKEETADELKAPAELFLPARQNWNLAASHKEPIIQSSAAWNYVGYGMDSGGYAPGDYPVGYTYADIGADHVIRLYFTDGPSVRVRFREYTGSPAAPDRGVVVGANQDYAVPRHGAFDPMDEALYEVAPRVREGILHSGRLLTYAGYSLNGGPFVPGEPPECIHGVDSNQTYTLYYTRDYRITEKFHGNDRSDEKRLDIEPFTLLRPGKGATELAPDAVTRYGGGEEYIGCPPAYLSGPSGDLWVYIGYAFTDDPVGDPGDPLNGAYAGIGPGTPGIPAVWDDETIIFIYEPCNRMEGSTLLLHVRQVVLGGAAGADRPLKGYPQFTNNGLTLPATCLSGPDDSSVDFTLYALLPGDDPEYLVRLTVPQNYGFAGHFQNGGGAAAAGHDGPTVLPEPDNGLIKLDYGEAGEIWLTLYIAPHGDPEEYSNSYATNDFGKPALLRRR